MSVGGAGSSLDLEQLQHEKEVRRQDRDPEADAAKEPCTQNQLPSGTGAM